MTEAWPPRKERINNPPTDERKVNVPDIIETNTPRSAELEALADRARVHPASAIPHPMWKQERVIRQAHIENPTTADGLVKALERGIPLRYVFRSLGITDSMWRDWEQRGDRGDEPYASVMHRVRMAQAVGVIGLLDDVRRASGGAPDKDGVWRNQWQAGKWLAEKADPELAREPEQRVQVELGRPGDFDYSKLSTAELEDLYLLTAKASGIVQPSDEQGAPEEVPE